MLTPPLPWKLTDVRVLLGGEVVAVSVHGYTIRQVLVPELAVALRREYGGTALEPVEVCGAWAELERWGVRLHMGETQVFRRLPRGAWWQLERAEAAARAKGEDVANVA